MTILQAVDYLSCQEKLSPHTLALYTEVRKIFPKFIEDQPKYKDMEKVRVFLETTQPAISFKAQL
jgi:histidine ammonia-lyase